MQAYTKPHDVSHQKTIIFLYTTGNLKSHKAITYLNTLIIWSHKCQFICTNKPAAILGNYTCSSRTQCLHFMGCSVKVFLLHREGSAQVNNTLTLAATVAVAIAAAVVIILVVVVATAAIIVTCFHALCHYWYYKSIAFNYYSYIIYYISAWLGLNKILWSIMGTFTTFITLCL